MQKLDEDGKPREGAPEEFLEELTNKAFYEVNQKDRKDYLDEYWEGSNNTYNYQGERENEETDVLDVTEPKTNEESMFLVHGITNGNP